MRIVQHFPINIQIIVQLDLWKIRKYITAEGTQLLYGGI